MFGRVGDLCNRNQLRDSVPELAVRLLLRRFRDSFCLEEVVFNCECCNTEVVEVIRLMGKMPVMKGSPQLSV